MCDGYRNAEKKECGLRKPPAGLYYRKTTSWDEIESGSQHKYLQEVCNSLE